MPKVNQPKNIAKLLVSLIICQCAGLIGSIFTTPAIPTWYATLEKPPFTPPSWLFVPAWLTLYLLMGISAFIIWLQGIDKHQVRMSLIIFLTQLALNVLWSVVFFGLKSPLYGAIVIIALWITILFTILSFLKLLKVASWLLLPYIGWVTFAATSNISILILNPS